MSGAGALPLRLEDEDEEEDEDYVPNFEEHQSDAEKEAIARRTRAQHSLKDKALEELEGFLKEPELYSPASPLNAEAQMALYLDFKSRLNEALPLEDGAETDAGEDDVDFVPREEKQYRCVVLHQRSNQSLRADKDLRADRGALVSKSEMASLLETQPAKAPVKQKGREKRQRPPRSARMKKPQSLLSWLMVL